MGSDYIEQIIELKINGEHYTLAIQHQVTLLDVLREHLDLTGTKEGCGTGECGSCTVLLDGAPILSCLKLAIECQGNDISTIEGQSRGMDLTDIQKSFLNTGAVQCGFCTPGMILATTALLTKTPNPDDLQIKKALEGHLCRCTGYNKIYQAIKLSISDNSLTDQKGEL